jgi:(1->4)-alpha-D-glucan 1-alpha-D-glucosylmutase
MGLLQDTVPNHMAYSAENPLIHDVLERGECSRYFRFFDVNWNHRFAGIDGKILAPFLGDLYGDVLDRGEINLVFGDGGFAIDYHGFRLPLRLKSYPSVLELENRHNRVVPEVIRDMISHIDESPEKADALKKNLWKLYNSNVDFKGFLDSRLEDFRGKREDPKSFDPMDKLLSEQTYWLTFWKVASEEINYRRFFIINDLISLRVERQEVFEHVHSQLFDLVHRGDITGLRIDHIDGLCDPEKYLYRLKEHLGDIYVVVEKILAREEDLPDWPVTGTTGYDFLNELNGIFCRKDNVAEFDRIYGDFTGIRELYSDIVYNKKKLMMGRYMSGEMYNLASVLKYISEKDRHGHDFTLSGLRKALGGFMASLSVYRTYRGQGELCESDRAVIEAALARARERRPEVIREIGFLGKVLIDASRSVEDGALCRDFATRLQQFTGPFMAKGFEDTVLYYYNRLISLNEVGGSPERFGTTIEEFHRFNENRCKKWPGSLSATATHDTKRGEDSRARINVLSEMPEEWQESVKRWSRRNRPKKKKLNGKLVPDRNEEYLIYQALIGAFPFSSDDLSTFLERVKRYLVKALREAKTHSDWMETDPAYEEAVLSFFQDIMKPPSDFFEDFTAFQKKVALFGLQNSLSQTLLKIASPGVPDFFQGTELWDFSFVDPDNRQPIDFERRVSYLKEIKMKNDMDLPGFITDLLAKKEDGRIKLFLIHRLLRARGENADLFQKGLYLPLHAEGMHKERIVAFARVHDGKWALTLASRFHAVPEMTWDGVSLHLPKGAPQKWRDAITAEEIEAAEGIDVEGRRILLKDAFRHLPLALLFGKVG